MGARARARARAEEVRALDALPRVECEHDRVPSEEQRHENAALEHLVEASAGARAGPRPRARARARALVRAGRARGSGRLRAHLILHGLHDAVGHREDERAHGALEVESVPRGRMRKVTERTVHALRAEVGPGRLQRKAHHSRGALGAFDSGRSVRGQFDNIGEQLHLAYSADAHGAHLHSLLRLYGHNQRRHDRLPALRVPSFTWSEHAVPSGAAVEHRHEVGLRG